MLAGWLRSGGLILKGGKGETRGGKSLWKEQEWMKREEKKVEEMGLNGSKSGETEMGNAMENKGQRLGWQLQEEIRVTAGVQGERGIEPFHFVA